MEVKSILILLRDYTYPLRLANLKTCYDLGAWPQMDVKDR